MEPLVQFSFTAGEFAEEFHGRSDLERYDLGAKELYNFVPQFGGGAFKRKGTLFRSFLQGQSRMIPFQFGDKAEDSFLLVMQPNGIFIFQDDDWLRRENQAATVSGNKIVAVAHGLDNRDWIYTNRHTSEPLAVRNSTVDDFEVLTLDGRTVDLTGVTQVRKLWRLYNPYATNDFFSVKHHQVFDVVRLTHPDYPEYELSRLVGGTWSIDRALRRGGLPLSGQVTIAPSSTFIKDIIVLSGGSGYDSNTIIETTGGGGSGFYANVQTDSGHILSVSIVEQGKGYTSTPTLVVSNDGGGTGATFKVVRPPRDSGFVVTVSAVYEDGTESGPMRPTLARNHLDFTTVRGEAQYSWPAVPKAKAYRVYRSAVYPDGKDIHIGLPLGFIGETRARSLTDNNITPDFSRTPQVYRDPFTAGRIVNATITNDGSGYADAATLTVSDAEGTGAVVWPVIKNGQFIGVFIANHGRGYLAPTFVLGGGGSGAAATLVVSDEDETLYPGCSFTYQQRVGYAGSRERPMTVFASKVNDLDNFSLPTTISADDPYEFTLDARRQSRIRHTMPAHIGLLLFTGTNVSLLRGTNETAIAATGAIADQQSYFGASEISPAFYGNDILYVQDLDESLRMLALDGGVRRYADRELSTLALHLFKKPIRTFVVAPSEKLGLGVYEDGTAFLVTIDKEQEVFGFSRMATQGRIIDACVLVEGNVEKLYISTVRDYNNSLHYMLEVFNREASPYPEDAVYMDAVVQNSRSYSAANVKWDGEVLKADEDVFGQVWVGRTVGFGGGMGVVTQVMNQYELRLSLMRPVTARPPEGGVHYFAEGDWWVKSVNQFIPDVPFIGAKVSIAGDGKQYPDAVVPEGGRLELGYDIANAQVGFRYNAELVTLPATSRRDVLEMRDVTIGRVRLKLRRAVGFTLDGYEYYPRYGEPWFAGSAWESGAKEVYHSGGWSSEGILHISDYTGMPLEILNVGYMLNASNV